MTMTDRQVRPPQPLPWALVTALGAVALVRPVLSIVGAYDSGPLAKPVGPVLFTVVIAVAWVGTVVVLRIPRPVPTLTSTGAAHAVFAIALNLSLQPFLDDARPVPPPGVVAVLLVNALQGALLGLVAQYLQRVLHRSGR